MLAASASSISRPRVAIGWRPTRARTPASARSVVRTRASSRGDDEVEGGFSLVPKDAADGLRRYRAVLGPLFLAGGLLHVPDVFGAGPLSSACGVGSFAELTTPLKALTLLWAVGGPVTATGLFAGTFLGDVGVTLIASAEIVLGIDFPDLIAPAELPAPIVAAQCVNIASLVALRLWETAEKRADD